MPEENSSYFDGKLLQLIGWEIVTFFVTAITFGIAYPWAVCKLIEWETSHTVINGRRLVFTGRPMSLFTLWIKWWLLCIVTLGIYAFWIDIDMKKWKTKHIHFAD